MDDDDRRGHGVEDDRQFLGPLAFAAFALAQRLFGPLAGGDVHQDGDRSARTPLDVHQRRAIAQHVADHSVVEGKGELKIPHVFAASRTLRGQFVQPQFAPILQRAEMAGPGFLGRRQRKLLARIHPQDFTRHAIALHAEAITVAGDVHTRRHGLQEDRQLLGPFAFAALALAHRLLGLLAFGAVADEPSQADDPPIVVAGGRGGNSRPETRAFGRMDFDFPHGRRRAAAQGDQELEVGIPGIRGQQG